MDGTTATASSTLVKLNLIHIHLDYNKEINLKPLFLFVCIFTININFYILLNPLIKKKEDKYTTVFVIYFYNYISSTILCFKKGAANVHC